MQANSILKKAGLWTNGHLLDFFGNGGIITRGNRPLGDMVYTISATPKYPVGTRFQCGDRVFYYCLAGAATLAPGELAMSPNFGGNVAAVVNNVVASGTAGERAITVTIPNTTNANVTANQYANGTVTIYSGTGIGQTYRIKSHPAAAKSATCVLTLYDKLITTLAATPKASMCTNLFYKVVKSPITTLIGVPVGVPLRSITAEYYGFLQTWGPCGLLNIGGLNVGNSVVVNLDTTAGAGADQAAGASSLNEAVIGNVIMSASTACCGLVNLTIMP